MEELSIPSSTVFTHNDKTYKTLICFLTHSILHLTISSLFECDLMDVTEEVGNGSVAQGEIFVSMDCRCEEEKLLLLLSKF